MSDPFEILAATWPAADLYQAGRITVRDGQGGGKRVSASTIDDEITLDDLDEAESKMRALGQDCLFSVRKEQEDLDTVLAESGYSVVDPTVILRCDITTLMDAPVPPVTCFPIWEPLQIMKDIWADGGIGLARLNVMQRVKSPKTGILGRINDRSGGAGFVACHGASAMIHALEILPFQRRSGLATHMMRGAAYWAHLQGAEEMLLAVTRANSAALALYSGMGMREIAGYHYRIKT